MTSMEVRSMGTDNNDDDPAHPGSSDLGRQRATERLSAVPPIAG